MKMPVVGSPDDDGAVATDKTVLLPGRTASFANVTGYAKGINGIMIDVAGEAVGQVNALAVYQVGEIAFGRPSRITAETFMGKAGVINIEREAKLSGAIHTKGFYILGGLLRHLLRTGHPLAFSASIAFEQSYGGIDGDSASSTEFYALLSAIAGIPLKQSLAVTGSA